MEDSQEHSSRSSFTSPWVWLSLLICSATLLTLGATWWWPLELLTHFRMHYIGLLTPLLLVLLVRKRFVVAAIVGGCLLWNVTWVAPAYIDMQEPANRPQRLRLMSANVLTHNREFERFLRVVHEEQPDLLLVMEIDRQWQQALEELREEYPHGGFDARDDNFGIGLLSKIPLQRYEVKQVGGSGLPSVEARLRLEGQPLTIIGTHPVPPKGAYAHRRNAQLEAVGKLAAGIEGPVIVVGDLNVTPWSPYFQRLLISAGLRDSRKGFGNQPTWPSDWSWAGIPIDHVLVSDEVQVIDRRVGAACGSDHRPVVVDLGVGSGLH